MNLMIAELELEGLAEPGNAPATAGRSEIDEINTNAKAILAKAAFMLTGYETHVCETAAAMTATSAEKIDMQVFNRLVTEFSKEIAQFKNGGKSA
jgi:hypothetical protein